MLKSDNIWIDKLSNISRGILLAYEKGYRVIEGRIINPKGKEINGYINQNGYKVFSVKIPLEKRVLHVPVHRFVAYRKFGDLIFSDLVVRHKDGNPLNNLDSNILIGTDHDNHMDKTPEARLAHSLKATIVNRKFTDAQMEQIRKENREGVSYNELMLKYDISSKGTISYIINNKYKTKV